MADPSRPKRRKPGPADRQRRKCKAKTTAGAPCRNYAITGATVCHAHGGRAPQTAKAAAKRAEEERLARAATRAARKAGLLEPGADEDPLRVMLLELGRAGAMARLYGEAVAELLFGEGRMYVYPDDDEEDGRPAILELGDRFLARLAVSDKAPVILSLYADERDRHARLGKLVVDAGLADRLVAAEEAVVAMLEEALDAAAADVGLDHAKQAQLRDRLGARLELIAGGAA